MRIQGRIISKLVIGLLTVIGLSAQAAEYEAVPGEYIVKMKPGFGAMSMNTQALSAQLGSFVKSTIPSGNIVVVKRPAFEMATSAVKLLNQNPMVDYAEPNYIYRINKTPNDPMFGKLWGLKNVGQVDKGAGVVGVDIDAERAWDITTGSNDFIIAVIDTGVDYNHPDLKDNIWTNEAEANGQPGVDDDGNGYVDDIHGYDFTETAGDPDPLDDHGHGSHCSGTIAGRGDDGKGIVGVAWTAKIMAVKFLSASGGGTLEGAIRAIDYATKMGAKIMSNSWGGGGPSDALKEAIQRSNAAGALFVAAAGNDGANNDESPHYPSNYEVANVLSVAALDNRGALASFSNFGRRTVHVAAPGVNIFSSVVGGVYDTWSGTSMATPHVSGIAALLLANEPGLTNVQLKDRLIRTARPLSTIKNKVKSGGLVNAYMALQNEVAPPDANDPANWASMSAAISTKHPYEKSAKEEFEVRVDGAKEISLYFEKFDTERGYDKVTLFDAQGNKVAELHGNYDDSFSPVISGNYVKIVFTADDTVMRYGFDITKVAYR